MFKIFQVNMWNLATPRNVMMGSYHGCDKVGVSMQRMTNWIGHLKAQQRRNIFVLQNLEINLKPTCIWKFSSAESADIEYPHFSLLFQVKFRFSQNPTHHQLNCWPIEKKNLASGWDATWSICLIGTYCQKAKARRRKNFCPSIKINV